MAPSWLYFVFGFKRFTTKVLTDDRVAFLLSEEPAELDKLAHGSFDHVLFNVGPHSPELMRIVLKAGKALQLECQCLDMTTCVLIIDALKEFGIRSLLIKEMKDDQICAYLCSSLASPQIHVDEFSVVIDPNIDTTPICALIASMTTNIKSISGLFRGATIQLMEAGLRRSKLTALFSSHRDDANDPVYRKLHARFDEAQAARRVIWPLVVDRSSVIGRLPTELLRVLATFLVSTT